MIEFLRIFCGCYAVVYLLLGVIVFGFSLGDYKRKINELYEDRSFAAILYALALIVAVIVLTIVKYLFGE